MKNKFHLYFILCFLFNMAGYSQSTVFESLSFESKIRQESFLLHLPAFRLQHLEKELPGPLPSTRLYG